MKEIVPAYYPKFRCIADRCRHSCCIGWEIDIDEDTLQIYDTPSVPLFQKLQKQIDRTDTPHFCLDKEERCPFLTKNGLCEIILTMGEENLCQICADHPRFRHFFSDHTETGLGLCCEAAAELVLFQKEPVQWQVTEDDGEPDIPDAAEQEFLSLRSQVYAVLQDRTVSVCVRLQRMLALCGGSLPDRTMGEWADLYLSLERLDPAWDSILHSLGNSTAPLIPAEQSGKWEIPLENLAVYFTFRHLADALDDDRLGERAAFCALSVWFLQNLFQKTDEEQGSISPETMTEFVRLYSAEIEYSEDNMEILLQDLL